MLIKYNKQNLWTIALPGAKLKTKPADLKKGKMDGVIKLKPGINEVPQSLWDQVKNYKGVQARIDQGIVEVIGEENDETKVEDAFIKIGSKSAKDAISLVKDTADAELLMKWKEQEEGSEDPRVTVLRAIEGQLEDIAAAAGESGSAE